MNARNVFPTLFDESWFMCSHGSTGNVPYNQQFPKNGTVTPYLQQLQSNWHKNEKHRFKIYRIHIYYQFENTGHFSKAILLLLPHHWYEKIGSSLFPNSWISISLHFVLRYLSYWLSKDKLWLRGPSVQRGSVKFLIMLNLLASPPPFFCTITCRIPGSTHPITSCHLNLLIPLCMLNGAHSVKVDSTF